MKAMFRLIAFAVLFTFLTSSVSRAAPIPLIAIPLLPDLKGLLSHLPLVPDLGLPLLNNAVGHGLSKTNAAKVKRLTDESVGATKRNLIEVDPNVFVGVDLGHLLGHLLGLKRNIDEQESDGLSSLQKRSDGDEDAPLMGRKLIEIDPDILALLHVLKRSDATKRNLIEVDPEILINLGLGHLLGSGYDSAYHSKRDQTINDQTDLDLRFKEATDIASRDQKTVEEHQTKRDNGHGHVFKRSLDEPVGASFFGGGFELNMHCLNHALKRAFGAHTEEGMLRACKREGLLAKPLGDRALGDGQESTADHLE